MGSGWGYGLALFATVATLALLPFAPSAPAKPLHPCRDFHAMGQLYGLGGKHVKCGFARYWARRYLRHGRQPAGWSCSDRFFEVGNCHRRMGEALFQWYVQD